MVAVVDMVYMYCSFKMLSRSRQALEVIVILSPSAHWESRSCSCKVLMMVGRHILGSV